MSLNITAFSLRTLRNGALPLTPLLDATAGATVVALGAQSGPIPGPCLIRLIADEDQRISASKTAGYVAPAATGIKLKAGIAQDYELPAGVWYINAVAG